MDFFSFLNAKPLFYETIDYARFPKIYEKIKHHFSLPRIIHIVGTNGKGTTGRFLAQMLLAQGLHVGHYTSPHLLRFNERIWIDGEESEDASLQTAHEALLQILNEEDAKALSYFEYTTLLAMLLFCEKCDYVVLEAGLGGEFDATNVFDKVLSIVTPIGYDHEAFLGNTIEAIATTKLNSIRNAVVLAKQYEGGVTRLCEAHAQKIHVSFIDASTYLPLSVQNRLKTYVTCKGYPSFLYENLLTACCALTFLGYDVITDSLDLSSMRARFEAFLPNVTLDVGHNPMAARALAQRIAHQKVVLIYNSYKDKDYGSILEILKPFIVRLERIEIDSVRALDASVLRETCESLGIVFDTFSAIENDETYVVFGSFSVVEAFLKQYERTM